MVHGSWLKDGWGPGAAPTPTYPPLSPPAAAPDPELRTIAEDGYQAATAAVPDAGAPFFAVLGLVPGRLDLKMGIRTVVLVNVYSCTAVYTMVYTRVYSCT